jgi:hypothetical protein
MDRRGDAAIGHRQRQRDRDRDRGGGGGHEQDPDQGKTRSCPGDFSIFRPGRREVMPRIYWLQIVSSPS